MAQDSAMCRDRTLRCRSRLRPLGQRQGHRRLFLETRRCSPHNSILTARVS